jgi:solute carrier family 40 (iron-regulated transporter), member 1
MITYLLSVGYSSFHIAATRTASVAMEISATFIAPALMARIGPIRAGMWMINWQILCLALGVNLFWIAKTPFTGSVGLIVGVILSRVGLWGFDLSVQVIIQEVQPVSTMPFPIKVHACPC